MGGTIYEPAESLMIVAVSGLMRTGTSVLAQTLHQLGCPMGTEMRFPSHPKAHLEWEDTEFTDRCLQGVLRDVENLGDFFHEYIQKREGELWGVKSPFLYPYLSMFKTAAQRLGHEVKIITTVRPYYDTVNSLREQIGDNESFVFARTLQYKLAGYRRHAPADLVVDIKDTWLDPEGVRNQLAQLIGVNIWA
jgi:hypothetical protein